MADMLRADIVALRIMAAGIRNEADAIAVIDPVDQIAKVARSMPNSAIGAAAETVGEPLTATLGEMADQLHVLAEATDQAHATYEDTEQTLKAQLDSFLHAPS
ncbi:hypothetical protein [Nocardia concava]|uniref:hypothetical protein n=1 Tax=Nocardia concava TaxID=257281 RepID=UPI000593999E|nr:hypothetical protein [Nocardia concava]